jgi:hypothetical protein
MLITPELLKKFGFKKDSKGRYIMHLDLYTSGKSKIVVEPFQNNNGWWLRVYGGNKCAHEEIIDNLKDIIDPIVLGVSEITRNRAMVKCGTNLLTKLGFEIDGCYPEEQDSD